jgi:glycosyltransferase involved in cell wall biosynthesis
MAGFDRRKNVPMLVRAFARSLISLPDDVALVLAGAPHSDNPTVFPPIEPVIRELGVGDRMVLTGRVTDADRVLLYQGAEGYVTPSAYEGFGLTPLEAMACGVPVIAANRTSLPEVVGDAGLLVEPELEAVAEAIVRLVTDRALRADLSRRGLARAAAFIWERTADLTVAAYREAHRVGQARAVVRVMQIPADAPHTSVTLSEAKRPRAKRNRRCTHAAAFAVDGR